MCMGDWRLGKVIRVNLVPLSVVAGTPFTIPRDANRVGLSLFIPGQTAGVVHNVTAEGSMILQYVLQHNHFWHFTLADHGDLPTKQFVFTSIIGTMVGSAALYTAPAEYINVALESFNSEYAQFLTRR